MFNPARLSLARQRRGLTQIGFASLAGVTRLTIHRYESGDVDPPYAALEAISSILKFPVGFFDGGDVDVPNQKSASFRGLTSMTASERDCALAAGALAFLLDDWAHERFSLPGVDVIDLGGEEPEAAARMLRQKLAIGERPIKNMVHLLEAMGVRVFSLVEETRAVDAFSLWRNGKPYVFLNTVKTAERSRFDAAHELGHLVLHKHGRPGGRRAEVEANRFASSFLIPESDVKASCPSAGNIQQIIVAKRRWGVAAMALAYRLHKLSCISEWQYNQFIIQLTTLGYRNGEPHGLQPEKSAVWQKILDMLRNDGITKNEIARDLRLPVQEIENLVFKLANLTTLDGSGTGSGKSRAQLRVVK